MSETIVPDQPGKEWAPHSMDPDHNEEPDVHPAGVRRNQQDTEPVDGETVINMPEGEKQAQRQPIQG